MSAANCPSCGGPWPTHNPGIVVVVCEYCGGVFYLDEEKVRAAGRRSVLAEGFSRLYRGATGSYHRKRFRVLGRVRYGHDRGFWDEWFLELDDGEIAWLTEDQHQLAVQRAVELADLRPFEHYRPGVRLLAHDTEMMVQEVGHAHCLGLEGALPRDIELDETYPYADATSLDGRYSLGLEFDGEPPSVYLGRWLSHRELALDDEGDAW